MEHWEELKPGGIRFLWDDALFPPGTDTFVLSAFPKLKRGLRVCDLGSGTGLLSLLLVQRQPDLSVTGIELLPEAAALMERAVRENELEDRIRVICADVRTARDLLPAGSFDLAVSNPPYFPLGRGAVPPDDVRRTARLEESGTLQDFLNASSCLLRWGGSLCVVHRPERLTDLLCGAREVGCEPKRLRLVCKQAGAAPSLVLLECRRGGKPGLVVEAELCLCNADGTATAETEAIYFRGEEVSFG